MKDSMKEYTEKQIEPIWLKKFFNSIAITIRI